MLDINVTLSDTVAIGTFSVPPNAPNRGMQSDPPFALSVSVTLAYFFVYFWALQAGGNASGITILADSEPGAAAGSCEPPAHRPSIAAA